MDNFTKKHLKDSLSVDILWSIVIDHLPSLKEEVTFLKKMRLKVRKDGEKTTSFRHLPIMIIKFIILIYIPCSFGYTTKKSSSMRSSLQPL